MKLYELNYPCKIKIISNIKIPPAHKELHHNEVLYFKKLDGMYSLCYTEQGEMVHPCAWTEVEIVANNSRKD